MNYGNKVFNGIAWSAIERISVQVLQFILGIILARILSPEEYGILGILLVFITISQVFIDSGFTKALIQKKNRTREDISSVFWFNLIIAITSYLILFFFSPIISRFYELSTLTPLLRVLSLSLIFNALFAIPLTIFTINMDFKTITIVNVISVISSGILAIYLAYNEYGVWALVWQTLIKSLIALCFMWLFSKWKPIFILSKSSIKQLFKFGSKLLVSSILATFFSNLNAILIGKYIGAKDLGNYTRGIQFTDFIFVIFNSTLNNVLLPALAPIQNNHQVLVESTKKIITSAALITFPIFGLLLVISEPLVKVLLTEKWLMVVPVMQIFCVARLITIVSSVNINLLYVVGRSDLVLKQQYVKMIFRIILLLIALKYGIIYIALAELLSTIIHFFINTYYPGKIMEFGAIKQIKAIFKIILATILMLILIIFINYININDYLKIITSSVAGLTSYIFLLRLLKVKEFGEIFDRLRIFIKSKI